MVALVRAEEQQEDIVNSALVAGGLDISNMGNKVIIDNTGGGPIDVRCAISVGTARATRSAGRHQGPGST